MRMLIYLNLLVLLLSCGQNPEERSAKKNIGLENNMIINTKWLYQDFGECQEVYYFLDSTFQLNSCEVAETFHGNFWTDKDTLFLLIPKPQKQKVVVSGDTLELDVQMLHYIRPTLEKMFYNNDTLFFLEIYNNYQQKNQKKITSFEINYLTQVKDVKDK